MFLGCKLESSVMEAQPEFWDIHSLIMEDVDKYLCFIRTLFYLKITWVFNIGVPHQYVQEPHKMH